MIIKVCWISSCTCETSGKSIIHAKKLVESKVLRRLVHHEYDVAASFSSSSLVITFSSFTSMYVQPKARFVVWTHEEANDSCAVKR